MNMQESAQLKAGDRVCQASNPRDTGVVAENSAGNVLINWKDGTRTLTAHAGMGHVLRVDGRRSALRSLLKLAPAIALVLGLGFYQLKVAGHDESPATTPAVTQRVQAQPAKNDAALAPAVTEEQWAALKQAEVTK